MKQSLVDELKELVTLAKRYLRLQTDCIRIQAAQKATLLISMLALGIICILLGTLVVVLLAMSAVCAFGEVLSPWLAYLCVAGILIVLAAVLIILRKHLVINPIAKIISKLIYPKK